MPGPEKMELRDEESKEDISPLSNAPLDTAEEVDDTTSSISHASSPSSSHGMPEYSGEAPAPVLSRHVSRASTTKRPSVLARTQTAGTSGTGAEAGFEVDFDEGDAGNPKNWPLWKKAFVIFTMSFGTTTVVMYSTSYTSAIPGLELSFGISELEGILGVTTYLIGMAVGSIILAPLSEMYGRRPVYIISMAMFCVLVLPCALAPNIAAILATRFFGAFAASAMISNAPGSVNDVVAEEYRALAFSIWSIGAMNGPVIGPVVGGFVYQYLGWRWTNWIVMILAGVAWVLLFLIPETYAPSILRARAARKRKEEDDGRWWSQYDQKKAFLPLLKINLSRPFIMAVTEPILIFWDVYVALVYGILYLSFVAYPIVFTEQRGWSSGDSGLAFCGIGVGSMMVICSEPLIRKVINSHKPDPVTGKPPPEAMVFPICVASISMPIGELWFAWTCTPNVPWIVPIIAGIPYGAGCSTIFIYGSNYLVYSYGMYAASALAGNAVLRSILGATLPLAGPSMYTALGSNWAGTLCALLLFACIPIPFVFYRYGGKIRMRSALIRKMQEDKAKQDRRRQKALDVQQDLEKRAEAEAMTGGVATGAAIDEAEDLGRSLSRA